ncbi:MAG: ATP-dependent zinc metalloprotease FtsH [Acidobacteria bacterium]|nr:ATP-dependent zinc metalloprotease FtsH [Acidobacteriota bacterium]
MLLLVVISGIFSSANVSDELSLDAFEQALAEGKIAEVQILARSNKITGTFLGSAEGEGEFKVVYPGEYEQVITEKLIAADLKFEVDNEDPTFIDFIIGFLPYILIFGIFIFVMMRMQGGGNRVMQFGKSRAKQVSKDQQKVTFKDVAGADEAVEELDEIREFLASPAKFRALGAKIPRGVLLVGPPGTGKTLLARAVAGEADVPFFTISGSDFVEMFVGVGASRVRDLFTQAKAAAPAIVFIDEIDAVGRHRGAGLGGGHDEREQTLNQLLVELDGFEGETGVIVLAATNRPDILDPALLRPGRFDRQIVIDRPDIRGREGILSVHSKGKPLADDVEISALARQTPGFTGADLANLINEGALLAARRSADEITMADLEESIDRVIAGPERKNKVISKKEREITAFHEAGHALVGFALPNADPVHKITIIPRGRSGGFTLSLPTEDRTYLLRAELIDRLAMSLGGRTAEEVVFGDPSSGATDDIEKATALARRMIMEWGMSDKLGPIRYGNPERQVFLGRDYANESTYSDHVAEAIDEEIRYLMTQAHEEARLIIERHRDALDRIANKLLDVETLDAKAIREIFFDVPKWEHVSGNGKRVSYPKNPVFPEVDESPDPTVEQSSDSDAEQSSDSDAEQSSDSEKAQDVPAETPQVAVDAPAVSVADVGPAADSSVDA